MKPNKALKRLSKIQTLMSDVAQRYSGTSYVRGVLQDAKAAISRAKKVLSLQTSSGMAKKSAPIRKAAKKTAGKKFSPVRKKAAVKNPSAGVFARAPRKSAPIKKAAKKRAARKTAPVSVQASAQTAPQEPMPAELTQLEPSDSEAPPSA